MLLGNWMLSALDWAGVFVDDERSARLLEAQKRSFDVVPVKTVSGRLVRGRDLQVIHRGEAAISKQGGPNGQTRFWYCRDDEGELYLALPASYRIGSGWHVEWEIQPACRLQWHSERALQGAQGMS